MKCKRLHRFLGVVLGLLFLMAACSQRPKPHHPQPEDGMESQVVHTLYAMMEAQREQKQKRLQAYFAETIRLGNRAEGKRISKKEAILLFARFLKDVIKENPSLLSLSETLAIKPFSRIDLQESETITLGRMLVGPFSLAAQETGVLLKIRVSTNQVKSMLLLVFSDGDKAPTVTRMHLMPVEKDVRTADP